VEGGVGKELKHSHIDPAQERGRRGHLRSHRELRQQNTSKKSKRRVRRRTNYHSKKIREGGESFRIWTRGIERGGTKRMVAQASGVCIKGNGGLELRGNKAGKSKHQGQWKKVKRKDHAMVVQEEALTRGKQKRWHSWVVDANALKRGMEGTSRGETRSKGREKRETRATRSS